MPSLIARLLHPDRSTRSVEAYKIYIFKVAMPDEKDGARRKHGNSYDRDYRRCLRMS
jgi:hypothetical protein